LTNSRAQPEPTVENDQEMIDLTDARSEEFAQLLSRCERRLFSYILALVWNSHDAEDLYQQTAMTLWKNFDAYERGTNFPAWACTTARLLVANFQRARRRRQAFLSDDLASMLAERQASLSVQNDDLRADALTKCMGRLSENNRSLVRRCCGGDFTIKQVAEQLGRPPQSIYNAICRIRHLLFDCVRRTVSQDGSL
jgi:RNA polymerase sigma-70 factor (ECF subfamily)